MFYLTAISDNDYEDDEDYDDNSGNNNGTILIYYLFVVQNPTIEDFT